MKRPVIVVGMDNTGKTTLCKKLSNKYLYYHIPPCGPGKTKKQMEEHMKICLSFNKHNFIFERFPVFEEMVYGKILRGNSLFTFRNRVFRKILKLNPLIIYCRPDDKTIFNFGDRPQMSGVISRSKRLLEEWDQLMYTLYKKFKVEIKTYDYVIDSWEDLI